MGVDSPQRYTLGCGVALWSCLGSSVRLAWRGAALLWLRDDAALPSGEDPRDPRHGLLTAGTLRKTLLHDRFAVPGFVIRHSGFVIARLAAALLHALPLGFRGGVVVAAVAHGAQFGGLHMPQVAPGELFSTQGQCARARMIAVAAVDVPKGDVGVADGQDA